MALDVGTGTVFDTSGGSKSGNDCPGATETTGYAGDRRHPVTGGGKLCGPHFSAFFRIFPHFPHFSAFFRIFPHFSAFFRIFFPNEFSSHLFSMRMQGEIMRSASCEIMWKLCVNHVENVRMLRKLSGFFNKNFF